MAGHSHVVRSRRYASGLQSPFTEGLYASRFTSSQIISMSLRWRVFAWSMIISSLNLIVQPTDGGVIP